MLRLRIHGLLIVSSALVAACGAPLNSADDVGHIFEGNAASLQEKTTKLCNELEKRSEPPSISTLAIDVEGCRGAGAEAQNYKGAKEFQFARFDQEVNSANEKDSSIHLETRSEVWLNKSLLGLISSVTKMMNDKKDSQPGEVKLPSNDGFMSNLEKPKITLLEKPVLDTKTLQFGLKLHYQMTGLVKIDHVITVQGKVIDNSIAVTISSGPDKKMEESFTKNFKILILIIPHAEDVYIDTFLDITVNNPGLRKVLEAQLKRALGSAMKSIIDMSMAL